MTPEERLDAREALEILAENVSLAEAARHYMATMGVAANRRRVTVAEACEAYLRHALRRVAEPTWKGYELHLSAFATAFDGRTLDDIAPGDLKRYLDGLTTSARHRWIPIRAMLKWAHRQEPALVGRDVTGQVTLEAAEASDDEGSEIAFLTVDEARAIMEDSRQHRAALAVLLFAGIRPGELQSRHKGRLDWSAIDMDAKTIRISGKLAKGNRRRVARSSARIIEGLPPTLWAWLETIPASERRGPVTPVDRRSVIERAKHAAGFMANKQTVRPWPHDGTRHSFATYHVALEANPGKTSLILGHRGDPTMLYNHYRGLATRREAEAYFEILP